MKNKILIILIIVMITLTGCFNKQDKNSDAYKFAEEYNSIGGKENSYGKTNRKTNIPKDNPFVYKTAEDISNLMDEGETFVVYFGFSTCPWCRSMIDQLVKSAKDNDIEKIYYVDVLNIRDTYQVAEDNSLTKTKDGTTGYMELIKKMENVLSDYSLENTNKEKVLVGEKRIYAPNVVAVVNGKAEKMVEGISEDLKDPYDELTSKMKKDSYNSFKCLWECLKKGTITCQKNKC